MSHNNSQPRSSYSWREFSLANKSFERFSQPAGRFWPRAKQPVNQNNFTDWDRDKTLGILLVYTVKSKFLSVASELDTGFALFCFLGDMEETFYSYYPRCVPESQTRGVETARNKHLWNGFFCPEWSLWQRLKTNWILSSVYNPKFKTNKFLSRRKQAQAYACMTKVWLFHASVMFETLCKFKPSQQRDSKFSAVQLAGSKNIFQ